MNIVALLSAVSVALSATKPSTTDDVEVLDAVLRWFVPLPGLSYKEIYLKCGGKKILVGGKLI